MLLIATLGELLPNIFLASAVTRERMIMNPMIAKGREGIQTEAMPSSKSSSHQRSKSQCQGQGSTRQ